MGHLPLDLLRRLFDGRAHVQQWSDLLRAEALSDP